MEETPMVRFFFLVLVSLVPVSTWRIFLYRGLFGFKISKNARIGMFNMLDVKSLTMKDNAEIRGIGNVFMSLHRVEMEEYSRIGGPRVGMNLFRGTANKKNYPPAVIRIGKCSIIELFHYFDLCGDVLIGDNVVIGGIRSVFFTHSVHKPEFAPIVIGDDVYIGSNCLFQMGSSIPAKAAVGMGSVVIKPIETEDSLVAGNPAKVVKEHFGYSAERAFKLRKKTYHKNGEFVHPSHE
jgi:hypothetical protein